jgi:hypothetical protein
LIIERNVTRSRKLSSRGAAVGASVLFLLLASCSGAEVDITEVENKLVEEQEKVSPDLEVGEASCPDDVDPEEGSTFECTVDVEGVDAPYKVTITSIDEEGGSARFDFEPAKPIIDVSKVVDFIHSQVNESAGDVEVDCGSEAVIVSEVGGTIDCTISDGTTTEDVPIEVKDLEGTVAIGQ